MDEMTKMFNKFCNIMENDSNGVQIGCYSIALVGLTVAVRRVRPFSRFKKPSDIPNRFIRERRLLEGFVERIEPNGALLMVKHKPLAFSLSSKGNLPVKVASVEVNGNGISWLQSIVCGNEIKFIPINKKTDCVECEVMLSQAQVVKDVNKNKKKKKTNIQIRNINVGETLVSINFAKISNISQPLPRDSNFAYYMTLKHAEYVALRKQLGYKYYIAPTKQIILSIVQKLQALILALVARSKQKISSANKKLSIAQ